MTRLENRFAYIPPAGKVPGIREAFALVRLDGLDGAVIALQEDAGAAHGIGQGETVAIRAEAGVALDEVPFAHIKESRDRRNIGVTEVDETRPAAAIGTALALIPDCRRCGDCGLGRHEVRGNIVSWKGAKSEFQPGPKVPHAA